MEPLFFKAENTLQPLPGWQPIGMLQWSRFFSKRKITGADQGEHGVASASMEPLFFKAENAELWRQCARLNYASMEPLFFKAENSCSDSSHSRRTLLLQWSRFFSKRKIQAPFLNLQASLVASMEPLFFKAENPNRVR